MRARRRVAHERLRPAERRRRAGEAERVEHRAGGVDAAGEVDRQHGRQARQLASGELVLRVVGQAGVVHGGDARMPSQRRSDLQRHGGLVALAHGERADPAQPVEGVVRRGGWRRAARRRPRSRRAGRRSPAITPSVASLCPQMPFVAECSTRSMPWRSGCWPIGVANVESTTVNGPLTAPRSSRSTRSSRGLDGDSAMTSIVRPGRTASAKAPGTRAVDDRVLDAEPGARALHEGDRAGVDLALDDDVVARRAQREHGRGDGAHARPEGEGVLGALELGDGVLERPHGRVGVAAVEVARAHARWPACGCRRGRRSARCWCPTAGR